MRLNNLGELRGVSGTTNVSLTNLSAGGNMTGGALTAQGGTLGLNADLVTNNGTVTVVTGGINNTSTGTSALPALRTNNGTLTLSQSVTGTGAVTNTGAVWLKSGTFRPTTYTQSGGSTRVDAPAVLRGGSAGTGAVAINGGSLTGGGNVQGPVTNAGLVQPGGNGTPLSVTSTYAQTAAGTFGAFVNGLTTVGTDYSKLTSTGAATLGGTLAIQTGTGLNPPVGTSVRILDAASRSGTFATITGRDTLPAGKYWGVTYDATGVSLVVKADPVASVANESILEGDTGTKTLTMTISLDQSSERTVSYNYATVAQTATAPSDYVLASGTATFAPGETSKTVDVTINGDTVFEPDETFLLQLSGAVNGGTTGTGGVATILNDDPEPPRITVTASSPNVLGQGAIGQQLTITGTGFDPTSTISFSKPGVTIVSGSLTYVDPTTMKVSVNVSGITPLGGTDVTVNGTNGTATCTGCLTITPRPTVTGATPQLGAGALKREVTITGTGFVPGATATIVGTTVISTSYIDANTLEALVSVPVNRAPASSTVAVTNPDKGRFACTTCYSTIAGVTLTNLGQPSFARGTTVTVTFTGTNFGPGVKFVGPTGVIFDGVSRVNDTTATVTVSVASDAPLGSGKAITVINPRSRGYGQSISRIMTITS